MKFNVNRIVTLFKRYSALLIFLGISFFLIKPKFLEYIKDVSYEDKYFIGDSLSLPTAWISFSFSTDNAFLPYEKIRTKISLYMPNEKQTGIFRSKKEVVFMFAKQTKSTLNENNKKPNGLQGTDLAEFSNPATYILLKERDNDKFYTGTAEFIYTREGSFDAQLLTNELPDGTAYKAIIKIGSSIDVMNKRTNNLVFILTVITVLHILYSELKPKKS